MSDGQMDTPLGRADFGVYLAAFHPDRYAEYLTWFGPEEAERIEAEVAQRLEEGERVALRDIYPCPWR